MDYLVVFVVSALSATILPMGSEIVLMGYASSPDAQVMALWLVATVGNTLGGVTNWFLGLYILSYQDKSWFPIKHETRQKAEVLFNKYGVWSLLFTWLPIIGDAIALVSGVLRTPLQYFLPLVFIGKAARYALILWGQNLFFSM